MGLHFKWSKMTILRHWRGGFSLFLHHMIRKNQAKLQINGKKWKEKKKKKVLLTKRVG